MLKIKTKQIYSKTKSNNNFLRHHTMERSDKEQEEFEKYRERVHGTESENENRPQPGSWARAIFAIIMVIVYVGVGILLLYNFFGWSEQYNILRYVIGPVLIIYGIWRAYRYKAGIDSRL